MSFHALIMDMDRYDKTWLDLFKAMLGDVDLFENFH